MKTRVELSNLIKEVTGCNNVYFRTPSKGMKYPAIRYELAGIETGLADNIKYLKAKRYKITVIDENPDSEIPDKILDLEYTSLDRPPYEVDGLNHWVINIYW